ncbi:MAG: dihydrofolate reductase [Gammaproteobacteria bacterium]|nr:dihydrofolate reductase [Gammaproteobacteria bacterium]
MAGRSRRPRAVLAQRLRSPPHSGSGRCLSRSVSSDLVLIAALDEGGLIGRGGGMPWHLSEDLRRFKRLTVGNTVLMGRKTFESIGRPLPGRQNWVLSRDPAFAPTGCRVFAALEAALAAEAHGTLFVIGGAELYRQTLPQADRLELTCIHIRLDGDTWFPAFDTGKWREITREDHPADARHAFAFSFVTLERRDKIGAADTQKTRGDHGRSESPVRTSPARR